jgi:hypothetical protein
MHLGEDIVLTAREGTTLPFDVFDAPTLNWNCQDTLEKRLEAELTRVGMSSSNTSRLGLNVQATPPGHAGLSRCVNLFAAGRIPKAFIEPPACEARSRDVRVPGLHVRYLPHRACEF